MLTVRSMYCLHYLVCNQPDVRTGHMMPLVAQTSGPATEVVTSNPAHKVGAA